MRTIGGHPASRGDTLGSNSPSIPTNAAFDRYWRPGSDFRTFLEGKPCRLADVELTPLCGFILELGTAPKSDIEPVAVLWPNALARPVPRPMEGTGDEFRPFDLGPDERLAIDNPPSAPDTGCRNGVRLDAARSRLPICPGVVKAGVVA